MVNSLVFQHSINAYSELYASGGSISHFQPLENETFKLFSLAKEDVHLINVRLSYAYLSKLVKMHSFVNALRKEEILLAKSRNGPTPDTYFYMLPVKTLLGTTVGYICRGVFSKRYHNVYHHIPSGTEKVPYLYGFYSSFCDYGEHEMCPPIVVCEGAKDCIFLKQFYPYVLANNKARLGLSSSILRNITNKLILVYDNDSVGKQSIQADLTQLRRLGFMVDFVPLVEGFKDPASHLGCVEETNILKKSLLTKILNLSNF